MTDYEHNKVYIYDATTHTFDPLAAPSGPTTSDLGKPEILVTANDVKVCGVHVARPPSIAPSQWVAFWELRELKVSRSV